MKEQKVQGVIFEIPIKSLGNFLHFSPKYKQTASGTHLMLNKKQRNVCGPPCGPVRPGTSVKNTQQATRSSSLWAFSFLLRRPLLLSSSRKQCRSPTAQARRGKERELFFLLQNLLLPLIDDDGGQISHSNSRSVLLLLPPFLAFSSLLLLLSSL